MYHAINFLVMNLNYKKLNMLQKETQNIEDEIDYYRTM